MKYQVILNGVSIDFNRKGYKDLYNIIRTSDNWKQVHQAVDSEDAEDCSQYMRFEHRYVDYVIIFKIFNF